MDFYEEFQRLIDEYNAGTLNAEELFEKLDDFAKRLTEEEQRHIRENLSEEELAIFDIMMKPRLEMTDVEEKKVKEVAKELLLTLKNEKLVLDWRKYQQRRAQVKVAIKDILDTLPPVFTRDLYKEKCDRVYEHVYDNYIGDGKSIYTRAG